MRGNMKYIVNTTKYKTYVVMVQIDTDHDEEAGIPEACDSLNSQLMEYHFSIFDDAKNLAIALSECNDGMDIKYVLDNISWIYNIFIDQTQYIIRSIV